MVPQKPSPKMGQRHGIHEARADAKGKEGVMGVAKEREGAQKSLEDGQPAGCIVYGSVVVEVRRAFLSGEGSRASNRGGAYLP